MAQRRQFARYHGVNIGLGNGTCLISSNLQKYISLETWFALSPPASDGENSAASCNLYENVMHLPLPHTDTVIWKAWIYFIELTLAARAFSIVWKWYVGQLRSNYEVVAIWTFYMTPLLSGRRMLICECVVPNWLISTPRIKATVDAASSFIPWARDQKYAISQTTFWNAFPWMKIFNFHWYIRIGSDNGLAANRRQVIICNNGDLVWWRIYESRGFDELTHCKSFHIYIIKSFIIYLGYKSSCPSVLDAVMTICYRLILNVVFKFK